MSAAVAVAAVALATGTAFKTTGFSAPESVLWDAGSKLFYVSNMAGSARAKDGEGWVSVLDAEGRFLAPRWANGLNAPKGLALAGGRLFVADIDLLAVIDVRTGAVVERIPVPGALFLNDVAAGPDGSVYVSDTLADVIWRLGPDGVLDQWASGDRLEGPNGLYVRGGRLYVASWGKAAPDFSTKVPGRLYWLDLKTKERHDVSKVPLGNLDGLAQASGGGWLVTDWVAGKLWRVSDPQGEAVLLASGLEGAADIGYDPRRRLIAVPCVRSDLVEGLWQAKLPR
ncbi:ATP/GTP-binding protein [bacterium]|nr:MAG: ATP/GTP-binding protein [bacterium]